MSNISITLLLFLLGLAVGSALNVLLYRLHAKKSWLRGRSLCPHCQHKLAWNDLLPLVSFILLKGHCRYCHKKISKQYPLIELATGVLFVLVYLRQNVALNTLVTSDEWLVTTLNLFITTVLIFIFVYDLKHYQILDQVILPSIIIVFFANLLLGKSIANMLLAALVTSLFFLIQFLLSRGRWLGAGDIRLGFFMGVILGWPSVLVALFLAYILGSIISVFLLAFKLKKWHSAVPFAVFLVPATFITMFWAKEIINWYLNIF